MDDPRWAPELFADQAFSCYGMETQPSWPVFGVFSSFLSPFVVPYCLLARLPGFLVEYVVLRCLFTALWAVCAVCVAICYSRTARVRRHLCLSAGQSIGRGLSNRWCVSSMRHCPPWSGAKLNLHLGTFITRMSLSLVRPPILWSKRIIDQARKCMRNESAVPALSVHVRAVAFVLQTSRQSHIREVWKVVVPLSKGVHV